MESLLKEAGNAKHFLYDDVAPGFHIVYRNETVRVPMPPHMHNAVEFYLNLTDLPNVLLGDRLQFVPAGSLILFPSYCIHRTIRHIGETYERYVMFIHTEWFQKLMTTDAESYGYMCNAAAPVVIPLDARQLSCLKEQFSALFFASGHAPLKRLSVFFSLMHSIDQMMHEPFPLRQQDRVSVPQQRVNAIISYLHEHLCEDITMADLSDTFFLDADYIARIFRKYTNTTIRRYIALKRITQAGSLLKAGWPATEASRMVGYQDYSLFYRNFHNIMGVSPTEFISSI